jgi:D-alanine-D-alanine ligase-like ATP-grasp enzyme
MQKDREFRVHVVKGTVIFVQEKLRKKEVGDAGNKYIRSHGNGWCFAFQHLGERPSPQAVLDIGVAAVRGIGLDFGAVDIAWSERSGATVLEVNTAPGIEQTTVAAYADAFQRLL